MKSTDWKEYVEREDQCWEAKDREGFIKNSESAFFFLFLRAAGLYIDCNPAEKLYINVAARYIGRIMMKMAEERNRELGAEPRWNILKKIAEESFSWEGEKPQRAGAVKDEREN